MGLLDTKQKTEGTPSPFDAERWETAKQLFAAIAPQLMLQMSGGATSETSKNMKTKHTSNLAKASAKGTAAGSPELFTPPGKVGNNDALNYALQLYGMRSQMPGSTKTTTDPSYMDQANSALKLYAGFNAMKGMFGGGGGGGGGGNPLAALYSGQLDWTGGA